MNYGEKIAYLRKSKGMTQEELGKVLSVTYQAVSKWERGASLPDFETMTQIARFFDVPIGYFVEGGENLQENAPSAASYGREDAYERDAYEPFNYIGTCTACGRMLKEDEAFSTSPKVICKDCAERRRQAYLRKKREEEQSLNYKRECEVRMQRGGGFDLKLIVSLVLAVAGYILMSVICFGAQTDDKPLYSVLLFIAPLALFACTHAVFDLIDEIRDNDGPEGYTRNLSFIVAAAFSAINLVLFLVLSFGEEIQAFYIGMLFISVILSFTFVSQFMWGGVVKEIFTCGGFTFKLPGFIFSLTPESILLMIITKVVLGIIAVLIFIATTVLFALIAILGSVFTFIPSVIMKSVKDKKA